MGVEFNIFKIDYNVFSITYEITKRTLWMVILKPHWAFASVTITTILANKETFTMHNLFEGIKKFFGGWLTFALEFDIVIAWIFWLQALLLILIVVGRLIRNRDDCHSFSDMAIYLLVQLSSYDPEDSLFWIWFRVFELYFYISTLYINYLIMAMPNFSDLYLLINNDSWTLLAVSATPILLSSIFISLSRRVGSFLGISNL